MHASTYDDLVVALALAGCGGAAADGPCRDAAVLGSWGGSIMGHDDTMSFDAACHGTSSYCTSTFDYPDVTTSSGQVLIDVKSTNGNVGCAPLGQLACSYTLVNEQLSFSCGGVVLTYLRR
jgi:hypothetical protein